MTLAIKITAMHAGMVMTSGLSGLKENFCSNSKSKKKVNSEGAYSKFAISICAGVMKIAKDKTKISELYFLLIVVMIKEIKTELNI